MYETFADFLMKAGRLYVVAELVSGAGASMREVRVNFITKGERERNHLQVPVSFLSLTPWFRNTKLNIRLDRAPASARVRHQASAPQRLPAAFDSGFTVEIPPDGRAPAVLQITFTGAVTNPHRRCAA